jgi:putative nucleotidyltransferase with HDIG domain
MSETDKILLVEDDDLFRSTIKRSLERAKFTVVEAPNGKRAKELLLVQKFALVISDIQMPFFSGIDLLEWIKKNCPVPVILMTGFSQILETKKGHDLGADDFIPKPFSGEALLEIVRKYVGEGKKSEAFPENLDDHYCKVAIEDFLSEKETEYGIYIRMSEIKYIKIAHKGGKIPEDRISAYKAKGIEYVYVKKEDFGKLIDFNLKVAGLVKISEQIAPEKKKQFMRHTGELILERVFVGGVDDDSFRNATSFLNSSMNMLMDSGETFAVLDLLSSHGDFLYTHSLGVSTFSVMIGKGLGWNSTPVLFRLAAGGLFHDIGKKEISREVLEKPRHLLSQKERNWIETHPTRGKEILEGLKTMPSEVVSIAYEHHENNIGQGYPLGLSKREIHPLARVVHVANVFCGYAIKSHPHAAILPPHEALKNMEIHKSIELDEESFAALKKLFVKQG